MCDLSDSLAGQGPVKGWLLPYHHSCQLSGGHTPIHKVPIHKVRFDRYSHSDNINCLVRPSESISTASAMGETNEKYDYDLLVIGAGSGGTRAARYWLCVSLRLGVSQDIRHAFAPVICSAGVYLGMSRLLSAAGRVLHVYQLHRAMFLLLGQNLTCSAKLGESFIV